MSGAPTQHGQQRMIGDLPFVEASRFQALDGAFWGRYGLTAWRGGRSFELLQLKLHDESLEGDVDLNAEYRCGFRTRKHRLIPFHEDVLPHWRAFAAAKKDQGGMEVFKLHDILLPPSPFFADHLVPALKGSNATLIQLDLVGCGLEPRGFACVAGFLAENASLTTLDLSHNEINNVDDAEILSLAIWNHPGLRFVNFSHCGFGKNDDVLSEVLGGAGNLETLVLEDNDIGSPGIALVAGFLAGNTTMTALSLGNNDIGDDNSLVLGRALRSNTSLRQLRLGVKHCWRQRVKGIEFPTFLDSKRATDALTHLDLSANDIASEGSKVVADYLARNPVLTDLNLGWNKLNSGTAERFACAMKQNSTLQHLDLRGNNYTDRAVPFLADLLRNNTTLLSLNLVYNKFKIETGRKVLIKQALCDASSLNAIVESNHTCTLTLANTRYADTHEVEMRNISTFDNEGTKIRYKVVLALFAMDNDLFNARTFDDVPLELMPRLLELVQQEVGYGGFGEGVVEKTRKRRKGGFNPTLARLYEVIHGWISMPLLFVRGPGKLKKKRKRKRHVMSFKDDDDEEWTPKSR